MPEDARVYDMTKKTLESRARIIIAREYGRDKQEPTEYLGLVGLDDVARSCRQVVRQPNAGSTASIELVAGFHAE